jgi:hypothetical protein
MGSNFYSSSSSSSSSNSSDDGFKGTSAAMAIYASLLVNTHSHNTIKCSSKTIIKAK